MFKVLDPRVRSNKVCDKFQHIAMIAVLAIFIYGLIGVATKTTWIQYDALTAAGMLLMLIGEFKPIRPKF